MARSTEGRLRTIERLMEGQGRGGWSAVDLDAIAAQVCRDHGLTTDQLEQLLWDKDEDHYPAPAVEAYWTAFGLAMRRAGLSFVDLVRLADAGQEAAS